MPGRLVVILLAGAAILAGGALAIFLVRDPAPPAPAPAPSPTASAPTTPPPPAPRRTEPPRPATPSPAPTTPQPTTPAAPTTGTLRVTADVPDATVFFDRVFLGTVPVTIPDITPGEHRLNVTATGYDGYAETIDVAPGTRDITVNFKEVKLDQRLPAVHKHAMGSCRGTLSATPQGIRYDTDNRGDAFAVPLADIETFELDYGEVNLRLKIRGGKTYNFTDADRNADRLLVFHREVDKVRRDH
jgi:hypothetical protein